MDLDYQYDHSPFDKLLGLRLEEASGDRVVARRARRRTTQVRRAAAAL